MYEWYAGCILVLAATGVGSEGLEVEAACAGIMSVVMSCIVLCC